MLHVDFTEPGSHINVMNIYACQCVDAVMHVQVLVLGISVIVQWIFSVLTFYFLFGS